MSETQRIAKANDELRRAEERYVDSLGLSDNLLEAILKELDDGAKIGELLAKSEEKYNKQLTMQEKNGIAKIGYALNLLNFVSTVKKDQDSKINYASYYAGIAYDLAAVSL